MLTGKIPDEFKKLSKLQMLNLGTSFMQHDAQYVSYSDHKLIWMVTYGMNRYEQVGCTGYNNLTGTISTELEYLDSLLSLSFSKFWFQAHLDLMYGPLLERVLIFCIMWFHPDACLCFHDLLDTNGLEGTIPTVIGNMMSLEIFDLSK